MIRRNWKHIVVLIALASGLLLAACGPQVSGQPAQDLPSGRVPGAAYVDSVEVRMLESFPVQVHATLRGNLSNGCTTLDEVTFTFDKANKLFTADIKASRPADKMCTEALVPFEHSVALDVLGLAAGTYTVKAQEATATFTFSVDNKSN